MGNDTDLIRIFFYYFREYAFLERILHLMSSFNNLIINIVAFTKYPMFLMGYNEVYMGIVGNIMGK